MATNPSNSGQRGGAGGKVGSDPRAAERIVGDDDFGASVDPTKDHGRARNYVSEEIKRHDKGGGVARSGTGPREAGVGGNDSGPGASSGGDIDAGADRLIGLGDPNQQAPRDPGLDQRALRPDEIPVQSPPVVDDRPTRAGHRDNPSSTSAADVNNETAHTDNAFKGDVTSDEATGGA